MGLFGKSKKEREKEYMVYMGCSWICYWKEFK